MFLPKTYEYNWLLPLSAMIETQYCFKSIKLSCEKVCMYKPLRLS